MSDLGISSAQGVELRPQAVVDGAMNGETFRVWVRYMLASGLRPGDLVVMDNLPAHKLGGVRQAMRGSGARLLYLPPCSPGFNPVEQDFAKLAALLGEAVARTLNAVEAAIGAALDAFAPRDAPATSQRSDANQNDRYPL